MIRRQFLVVPFAILLMISAVVGTTEAQDEFASDAIRLSKSMKLTPGQTVAEIGAGEGQHSVALSRVVGSSGRVYATDLSADRLRDIQRAARAAHVHNIVAIEGHDTTTKLRRLLRCGDSSIRLSLRREALHGASLHVLSPAFVQ